MYKIFNEKELLIKLIESGILNTAELAKNMNLENEVKKVHPYSIRECKKKDKVLFVTDVKTEKGRKQISAKTKELLYEKLLEHYALPKVYSLEELFPLWLPWHMDEIGNEKYTRKRYEYFWKKHYLPDKSFIQKPITELTAHDIKVFLSTFKGTVSKTTLGNIKSIVNQVFDYAIDKDIVNINVARQIKISKKGCKSEIQIGEVAYTDEDRKKLVSYLKDSTDPYDEVLVFLFYICDRLGEVRALKWEDIDFKGEVMYIKRQIVRGEDSYITEKDATKTGIVKPFKLSKEAVKLLMKWRKERPFDSGYVFKSRTGKALREDTVRDHLKKACKATGVVYRKSHGTHAIRAWAATKAAQYGDLLFVMAVGGWTDKATAQRYMDAAQGMDRKLVDEIFA